MYIRYLRKKIDDPFEKKLIHTVRGAGYVLREEEKRRDETNLAEMETDDSIYAADDLLTGLVLAVLLFFGERKAAGFRSGRAAAAGGGEL